MATISEADQFYNLFGYPIEEYYANLAAQKAASTPTTKTSPAPPANNPGGGSAASNPAVAAQQAAKDARRAEVAKLTLSTVPEIAAIQLQAQAEYVETGRWNPTYEAQADAIRKGLNPLYPGGDKGFTDPQYFLPGAGTGDNVLGGIGTALGKVGSTISTAAGAASGGTLLLVGMAALFLLFGGRSR